MNQGEENRFDGLLRNKFDNFEQNPSHEVWDNLSTKLPSATPRKGIKGIRPFLAGLALGMTTMFGAGTAYLHFSGTSQTADELALTNQSEHSSAYSASQAQQSNLAATDASALGLASEGPSTDVSSGHLNMAMGQQAGAAASEAGPSEQQYQARNQSRVVTRIQSIKVAAPVIRFVTSPATFITGPGSSGNAGMAENSQINNSANHTPETARANTTARNTSSRLAQANQDPQQSASGNNSERDKSDHQDGKANAAGQTDEINNNILANTARKLNVESAWLIGLELDTTISQELKINATGANKPDQLQNLLKAQATVLALLQNRNDSLQIALNHTDEDSLAAKARIIRNPVARSGGSVRPPAWPFPSKWAMSFIVETTPSWGDIQHGTGVSSAKETISRSVTPQIRIRHRVNSRLSISGGAGITQVHSSLRYSRSETGKSDTVIVDNTPVVNIQTWQIDQSLRPNYNFITIPFAVHQKIGGTGRLSIGLSAGTQIVVFSGGSKPVWQNDRYQLEKVSMGDGPFRPISAALHGSLDLSVRVSPKMNLMASPTLRAWAINPFKDSKTTYNMIPGLQVGMGWDF